MSERRSMKFSNITKVSQHKFNEAEYEYDLTTWDGITCLEINCNKQAGFKTKSGKSVSKFCSNSCSRKTTRRKNSQPRSYQIQCNQCHKYFITKYCKSVHCSLRCKYDYENNRSNNLYKEKIIAKGHVGNLVNCQAPWCYNLFVPKFQSSIMCSKNCSQRVQHYKTNNIKWSYFYRECGYRFCNKIFLVNYTKSGTNKKMYCSVKCGSMEHHYTNRLPGRWAGKKQRPMYLYLMFNSKLNCYKYGITVTKKKRFTAHESNGFKLLEYRYYPKNASMIETTFKNWLKFMNYKPAVNSNTINDGWSETVSAEDIPKLTINYISNICKQYA